MWNITKQVVAYVSGKAVCFIYVISKTILLWLNLLVFGEVSGCIQHVHVGTHLIVLIIQAEIPFTNRTYRIVSNKRPGGVAIFQKGDVYKRQVFNAKMQWLSLFTITPRREI